MLQSALENAFVDLYHLNVFTRTRLGEGIHTYSTETFPHTVTAMIAYYETKGRLPFIAFLRHLEEYTPNEELKAVTRGVADNLPRPRFDHFEIEDPCQTLFPGDRAYFNRHNVRLRLAELVAPNVTRTVAIHGPTGAGKTHSGQLVLHIEDRVNPPFKHVWIDLRDEVTVGYNAGVFMRSVGRRMKLDVKNIPAYEPQGNWINELRDWFLGELNDQHDLWWLVIDGVSQVDLGRDVRDLLRLLVKEAERSTTLLRLLLLGCADNEILSVGQRVRVETLEPVDEEDIREFLIAAYKRRQVSIEPEGIDELVRQVMANLPIEPHQRMRLIEERVAIAANEKWE